MLIDSYSFDAFTKAVLKRVSCSDDRKEPACSLLLGLKFSRLSLRIRVWASAWLENETEWAKL
jgi:hypothetical protein